MEAEAARRRGLASTGARARHSGAPGEADIGTGDAGPHSDRNPGPSTVSSGQAFSARSHLTPAVEEVSESDEAEPSAQGGSMHGNRRGGRQPARGRAGGRRARVTATAGDQAADGRRPLQQRPAMGRTRRQAQSARTAGRTAVRSPPLRRSVRNVSRKRQEALRPVQRKAPKARKQRKRLKRIADSPGLSNLDALAQVHNHTSFPVVPACAHACATIIAWSYCSGKGAVYTYIYALMQLFGIHCSTLQSTNLAAHHCFMSLCPGWPGRSGDSIQR